MGTRTGGRHARGQRQANEGVEAKGHLRSRGVPMVALGPPYGADIVHIDIADVDGLRAEAEDAVALGFAAIALFAGYTRNVFDGLQRQSIYGEMLGHLTLSKTGMRKEGKLDPERYLLTAPEVERITALLREEAHVDMVAPRLA